MAAKNVKTSITMQEVAERCGVSKMTVSLALRGDLKQVSQETIDHIQAVAREFGYNPGANHAARRLALKKSNQPVLNNTIGLLLWEGFYEVNYDQTLFRGVLEVLAPKYYALVLGYIRRDVQVEDLPCAFRRDEIDAFLTCDAEFGRHLLDEMCERYGFSKRPVVSMIYQHDGCSAVVPDHRMAGYLLAHHLLSLGHRHILHFADSGVSPFHPFALRLSGYRQAYQEMGLDSDTGLHYMHRGSQKDNLQACAENVLRMLDAYPDITAILAPYDEYAGVLIDVLSKHGKRVPEDISIVGLDDTDPALNEQSQNILTTVRMPLLEIGRQSAELLLQRISNEETEDITITLPVELIKRASTCPPRIK